MSTCSAARCGNTCCCTCLSRRRATSPCADLQGLLPSLRFGCSQHLLFTGLGLGPASRRLLHWEVWLALLPFRLPECSQRLLFTGLRHGRLNNRPWSTVQPSLAQNGELPTSSVPLLFNHIRAPFPASTNQLLHPTLQQLTTSTKNNKVQQQHSSLSSSSLHLTYPC